MRYFVLSLGLSLRARIRNKFFWLLLLLVLAAGVLARGALRPDLSDAAVRVGAVLPDGAEAFRDALDSRSGELIQFIYTDESTARRKVASSQWDCALILPEDFGDRLADSDLTGAVTLLTGPGSAVYPLVREAAAAALLELVTGQIASDYLLSSGIAGGPEDLPPQLAEPLPQEQRVRIGMETLTGRPLDSLELARESFSRIIRGSAAAALLVWMLFTAADLGRWLETGPARRMRPALGRVFLMLPRLTAASLPAFLLGAAVLLVLGELPGPAAVLALALYLAFLGALALLLASVRPVWTALPAVIPFAAASVFVLSPVFVDMARFFPWLGPLSRWLPATLYLQGGEGDPESLVRLLVLTAVLSAAAFLLERLLRYRSGLRSS